MNGEIEYRKHRFRKGAPYQFHSQPILLDTSYQEYSRTINNIRLTLWIGCVVREA